MYRDNTVAVVVPAYNEGKFVRDVIESVPAYVDRIYAIDDASTDDTWAEIRAAANQLNGAKCNGDGRFGRRVVPIQHSVNKGVGGAIKTGYLRAREDRIDVTAIMGGDAQMRPEALEYIVEPVATGRADYAKGNRLVDEQFHADMPRFRYVGNRILSGLTKIASGYWGIEDPQNGFTAISLEALETIDLENMYEFYGYCNDLLVKLNVAGMRVVDVPQEARYDDEESHIEYSSYIPRVSFMLARNFVWRIWRTYVADGLHPVAVFTGLATLTGLAGVTQALRRLRRGEGSTGLAVLGLCVTSVAAALGIDREHEAYLDWREDPDREPAGAGPPRTTESTDDEDAQPPLFQGD